MKKLISVVLPALLGAVAGSLIRQKVKKSEELVAAAHPVPLVAGTVAGLLSPKAKSVVALMVSLNVASNYPR